jgi:hypothetical protein
MVEIITLTGIQFLLTCEGKEKSSLIRCSMNNDTGQRGQERELFIDINT